MTNKEIIAYVFGEAAKSNVEKRKVGCVIIDEAGTVIGKGFNRRAMHAEIAALSEASERYRTGKSPVGDITVYVSHEPCPHCSEQLMAMWGATTKIEVVKAFMKFDGDKLRYDLVPPSALEALASVITLGARKYKPHNWKTCEEPERYIAALYRHLEAWRRGEECDEDSGMPHLAHAMTNLAFMLELGYNPTDWSKDK